MQILQERLSCPSSTVANSNLLKEVFRLYPVTPRTNTKSSPGKVTTVDNSRLFLSTYHSIHSPGDGNWTISTATPTTPGAHLVLLAGSTVIRNTCLGTAFRLFLCSITAMILRGVIRDRVVFSGRCWFYPNCWLSSGALLSQIRRSASGRTMLTRPSMWFKNRVNIGRVRFQAHRLGGRSP